MREHPGFKEVLGNNRGQPAAAVDGERRLRYGRLRLRSYNPQIEVLVRPQRVRLDFPPHTDLASARASLRAVSPLAVSWVKEPKAWAWECGCGGDAFSGLIPCDEHMSDSRAPSGGVIAEGVWVPVPRAALPQRVRDNRCYPVLRALLPDAAFDHVCVEN